MAEQDESRTAARRVVRSPVRRTPRLRPFLGTGAVLGVIVGILVDALGPGGTCEAGAGGAGPCSGGYESSSSLAYFVVLGALVGLAVAAILAALLAGRQGKN